MAGVTLRRCHVVPEPCMRDSPHDASGATIDARAAALQRRAEALRQGREAALQLAMARAMVTGSMRRSIGSRSPPDGAVGRSRGRAGDAADSRAEAGSPSVEHKSVLLLGGASFGVSMPDALQTTRKHVLNPWEIGVGVVGSRGNEKPGKGACGFRSPANTRFRIESGLAASLAEGARCRSGRGGKRGEVSGRSVRSAEFPRRRRPWHDEAPVEAALGSDVVAARHQPRGGSGGAGGGRGGLGYGESGCHDRVRLADGSLVDNMDHSRGLLRPLERPSVAARADALLRREQVAADNASLDVLGGCRSVDLELSADESFDSDDFNDETYSVDFDSDVDGDDEAFDGAGDETTDVGAPDECAVCLELLDGDSAADNAGTDGLTKLQHCHHVFHYRCVRDWCSRDVDKRTCPLCRREIGAHELSR